MTKTIDKYRQTKIKTATPGLRIVMLYDGVIKHLHMALELLRDMEPQSIEGIHNALQNAGKIVLELKLALDLEKGGGLAQGLQSLYEYWLNQLSEANVRKDSAIVQELLSSITDMRETWAQAETEARKQGIS